MSEHPPATYLHLRINDLRLTWRCVDTFLLIARRPREQLTAHLHAAQGWIKVQRGEGVPVLGPYSGGTAGIQQPLRGDQGHW
ncbi:MAG: hypothetical protein ACRDTJ_26055 [Pseudonocardiaceae bacterium]